MNRQEYWKSKGYTEEQIQNHLQFERRKAKESRERRTKANEKNKDLIKQIKEDLVGKTFHIGNQVVKILSIRPTVDGIGFYHTIHKTFSDGSSGNFRSFSDFEGYNKEEFIKWLGY